MFIQVYSLQITKSESVVCRRLYNISGSHGSNWRFVCSKIQRQRVWQKFSIVSKDTYCPRIRSIRHYIAENFRSSARLSSYPEGKAVFSSQNLVDFYQIIQHHIPDDSTVLFNTASIPPLWYSWAFYRVSLNKLFPWLIHSFSSLSYDRSKASSKSSSPHSAI